MEYVVIGTCGCSYENLLATKIAQKITGSHKYKPLNYNASPVSSDGTWGNIMA